MKASKNRMWKLAMSVVTGISFAAAALAAEPLYFTDFENAELDKVPDDMLVLDGGFGVKQADGNKVLELPGAPLDTFGVLFGPTQVDGVVVSCRIKGDGKGRRYPSFGVSLGGVGGYRLQVSPAKKAVEIIKGDETKATTPLAWESATWTQLKLQVRKVKDGEWVAEGKVWKQGTPEPTDWMITEKSNEEPTSGRPAIWGNPFSGTPIQFDDLKLEVIGK